MSNWHVLRHTVRRAALRDAAVGLAVAAGAWAMLVRTDALSRLAQLPGGSAHGYFDEVGGAVLVAAVVAFAYCLVQWGRLAGEVSRRAHAERALYESEARNRTVLEVVPDGILLHRGGRVLFANPAAARLFGSSSPTDLLGRDLLALVHPDFHDAVRERVAAVGERGDAAAALEERLLRLDGTAFDAEITGVPLTLTGEQTVLAVVRDVTERNAVAEQLRRSQRLEAVGQLAGGVAHDFNNLLTVIASECELSLMPAEPGAAPTPTALTESFVAIKAAADRATALTRQLLAFSRRQVLQPQAVDVSAAVRALEPMLRRLITEDITVVTSLDAALPMVTVDPAQLDQVIINLAVNARDAMSSGGRLTIETTTTTLDAAFQAGHGDVVIPADRYVVLTVSDTGCGMDEATRARVFEPFFTTKEAGRGTGLGLATVYGIVKQSGGYIWVYSMPRIGTTFRVYLPLASATAVRTPRTPAGVAESDDANASSVGQHAATILLVEDDDSVRMVAARLLRRAGYTVLEAAGADDALRVAGRREIAIDLLFTDVVMPEMSGPELAHRVRTLRPEIAVLFSSGYTDDAALRQRLFEPGHEFIGKPYTLESLQTKVREVLDALPTSPSA